MVKWYVKGWCMQLRLVERFYMYFLIVAFVMTYFQHEIGDTVCLRLFCTI